MKKIQIAFASLAAIAGIGGAYATTHQSDSQRAGNTYNWYTVGGRLTIAHATLATVTALTGCKQLPSVTCLRGTNVAAQLPSVTIYKQ